MKEAEQVIAFFDFDGTLTPKDSFLEFIKYTHGYNYLILGFLFNFPFVLCYLLKMYPNNRLKERIFNHFYGGIEQKELEQKGEVFCDEILPKIIHPRALTRLNFHLEKKHKVYLLTASSSLWLNKWCTQKGIEIIGTEFEIKKGYYTGRIKGNNCYGKEKLIRIYSLFFQKKDVTTFGYGDSRSDDYFLSKVNFGFKISLKKEEIIMKLLSKK